MGITDRQYMRDPSRSFGSIRGHDIDAVILLMLLNVAVWLVWQFAYSSPQLNEIMQTHFTVRPSGVFEYFRFHTLLTATISHENISHIFFNMLFFWYLGRDVEVFYGRNNLIALYVFAGVISSLAQCGLGYWQGNDIPCLGASGSIMGVAVAAAFIDPNKKLYIWGILPIKLWMLVPAYVLMDFSGAIKGSGDNIGHAAHLGGAFGGLLFYLLDLRIFASRGRTESAILRRVGNWWRARKFRVVEPSRDADFKNNRDPIPDEGELVRSRKPRVAKTLTPVQSPTAQTYQKRIDSDTAQRVDDLLAKISREGLDSLSPDEREFLKRSSEKYKR
jgi:membrane associated rhomboid family serine protease